MYSHTHESSWRPPSKSYKKNPKTCKAKRCGAGLENKVVNCRISAHGCSRVFSDQGMCRMCGTKVTVLQSESEAKSCRVH